MRFVSFILEVNLSEIWTEMCFCSVIFYELLTINDGNVW